MPSGSTQPLDGTKMGPCHWATNTRLPVTPRNIVAGVAISATVKFGLKLNSPGENRPCIIHTHRRARRLGMRHETHLVC